MFRIWYHEYKSSSFDKMLHIYNLIYTFTSQSKNGIWDWKITKMNWCSKTGVNWFEQSCLCVTIIKFPLFDNSSFDFVFPFDHSSLYFAPQIHL